MTMTEATWTTGDTGKPLKGRVILDKVPVSLVTAVSLEAHIKRPDNTVVSHSADILLGDGDGVWSMTWHTGDLTIPGPYKVEIQVTWEDDTIQTFGPEVFPVRAQFA